jgi:NAD(P)-dependent dehydrogenase (short-subunit alcohol dehydrogenase family)
MAETDYRAIFRVDGKVALVTGAARGLGAESARALLQGGARVLITDIDAEVGAATAAALEKAGHPVAFLRHDVTNEAHWEAAVAEAVRRFGGLDIVVNNAGVERLGRITEMSVDEFRFVMDVNATGTFLGLKHGVRVMAPGGAAGKGGSIVNISSGAGMVGVGALGAYCAAKGAVRLLTKSAAVECAQTQSGIRVNSIHPGLIKTEMGSQFLGHFVELGLMPDVATAEAAFNAAHPMGMVGEPRDIASAVLFLASDASRWMTGAEVSVDGGFAAS